MYNIKAIQQLILKNSRGKKTLSIRGIYEFNSKRKKRRRKSVPNTNKAKLSSIYKIIGKSQNSFKGVGGLRPKGNLAPKRIPKEESNGK